MTSTRSVLAAFAIILIDLLGRAGLDKMLAMAGGPSVVALWAQLQSVLDLVSGVAITGVAQGLTVTVTQARDAREERALLRLSLRLGLVTALSAAIVMALASPVLSAWLTGGRLEPALMPLAALAGWLTVIPATLNAYWLGKHRQPRMLGLALVLSTVWALVAWGAWMGLALFGLALVQCAALLVVAGAIWRYLRRLSAPHDGLGPAAEKECFQKLIRFVPVGLAIGIMSPVSMLLIRGQLSGALGWDDVGYLQALWRASEWVTSAAAGVLSLVFLPRLSATYGTPLFRNEMLRAGSAALFPSAILLLLIGLNQHALLSMLYDARFAVSDETAALFLLGCWVRIAAWIFLFGLFAAHRTTLIVMGEVLSLPLLAALLWAYAGGMTLERTAWIFLGTYCVYLCFNAAALLISRRGHSAKQD